MASRILLNSAEEIDATLYTGHIALVLRGTGLVRDTGVQNINGQKFFYDTITFYSGLNVSGDFVPSGNVAGNLTPKTDNLYDLGSVSNEWRNGYFDGLLRTDTLHVDENANISGNLLVSGHVTGSGDGHFYGGLTVNGHSQVGSLASLGTAVFSDTVSIVGDSQVGKLTVTGGFVGNKLTVSGSGVFSTLFVTGTNVPASTGSAGTAGQIVWGSGYLYVCTGTNAWGRTHLTGWI